MTAIRDVRWHALRVSPKTVWSFVEVVDDGAASGIGEATLGGREAAMAAALERFREALVSRAPEAVDLSPHMAAAAGRPEFAVLSALEQALCDLAARQRGVSMAQYLGPARRQHIGLYANINRSIADRTPAGFAGRARDAVSSGFAAVKIAPFDEVELRGDDALPIPRAALDQGLARIAAVREAVGGSVRLMADAHWRLNEAAAQVVLREAAPLGLHWLECPLPETAATLGALKRLRGLANTLGIRLAGCEEAWRIEGFMPFLEAGAYDVMMPDVKYVGGPREMLAVAEVLRRHGVVFSPHNPTGPVCHAASLHVCAVAKEVGQLEVQYRETPWFDRLAGHALPAPASGTVAIPGGPGLGIALAPEAMAALARSAA